jgi:hypothetical protein
MDLAVYVHVATVGHYLDVVDEINHALEVSGLAENAAQVTYGVVGGGPLDVRVRTTLDVHTSPEVSAGEFFTLRILKERIDANLRDGATLYLHTKGVTQPLNACIDDWRRVMLHFTVLEWRDSLQALQASSACGVDYQPKPMRHFSGNFWWARDSYLRSLPSIDEAIKQRPPRRNAWSRHRLSQRHMAEFWIGMGHGNLASLHQTRIDIYERHLHRYPEHLYRTRV